MDEQTKTLLYNLACGIIDLINENERLQRENKNLTAYKERRAEMDAEHLKMQTNAFYDTISQQESKKYRIWFKHDGGTRMDKTEEVFDSKFDANERCFWLNDNAAMSAFGQYIYEEEDDEE
jgi:hypothetical protein